MDALILPFEGLPLPFAVLFATALAISLVLLGWTASLFFRGRRAAENAPEPWANETDHFKWVFLVPALNEALTIQDSVRRLLMLPLRDRHVVVIDDGSDDETGRILAAIDHPALHVLRRDPPRAREGKAAALNHAYARLDQIVDDVDRTRVIVTVIDADGRLDAEAPRFTAAHFREHRVAGVQTLVRMYNRGRLLTWFQDLEFSVYGYLYQAGRNAFGTAGLGGNGQFTRLFSLDCIAGLYGPWRDGRLTEDQDLCLRLNAAGFYVRQELRAVVSQQALPRLRPLLRQRTRWSQGNLQAMSLLPEVTRARLPVLARAELLLYLLIPVFQGIVGISLLAAIGLAIAGDVPFWDGGPWWQLLFFYLLGFGGTMFGCIATFAGRGPRWAVAGFLLSHPYAFYSWLLWPALIRSLARQLLARRAWAKTDRVPIAGAGRLARDG